jgi:HSP20 family protein
MSNKAVIRRNDGFPGILNNLLQPWGSFFDTDNSPFENLFNVRPLTLPSVNVLEKKDKYEISVAAPGLKKEDFNIDLEGDMLTISAEKETSKEDREDTFTRQEFNYTSFSRSFTLPAWVNKDKIDARYEDGLLFLDLPKTEQAKQENSKHVTVK